MRSQKWLGYLFLSLAMLLVGSTVVTTKLIVRDLPPFLATTLRFAIAVPILFAILRITKTPWPRPTRRDWLLLFFQAATGCVGYTVLLLFGMRLTSAASGGVLMGTLPAFTGLLAVTILGEKMRPRLFLAVLLATAGVLTILVGGESLKVQGPLWKIALGNTLVLLAVVFEALFLTLNRKVTTVIPPIALATIISSFGLLLAALAAAVEFFFTPTTNFTVVSLGAVAYYAIIPTVVGLIFWYEGAARTTASESALFTALMPVSAMLLAAFVLHETLGARQLLGGALVIAAVFVGTSRRGRAVPSPVAP